MGRDDLDAQLPAGAPKLRQHFFATICCFFLGLFINYVDILFIGIQALRDLVMVDPTATALSSPQRLFPPHPAMTP